MCTAITYKTEDFYFGRNLDLEYSYQETVTVTPRKYPFNFKKMGVIDDHYAMIGMAFVSDGYPLYYDAVNEKGLCMAGLNFPDNAYYRPVAEDADNVMSFEFIPWILSQCASVEEARVLLSRINIADISFSEKLPASPLHWMIADSSCAVTVEPVREGLKIYENPAGVLTNNPTFDMQLFNLNNYMHLTTEPPVNSFSEKLDLHAYSRGMGGMGLPGDLSSASRFVKAAFTRVNSVSGTSESESISQFFHILGSVAQQKGCVHMGGGKYEYTIYSSCCNADKGIYYYTTYENSQITAVDMNKEELDGEKLASWPLVEGQQILRQN